MSALKYRDHDVVKTEILGRERFKCANPGCDLKGTTESYIRKKADETECPYEGTEAETYVVEQ